MFPSSIIPLYASINPNAESLLLSSTIVSQEPDFKWQNGIICWLCYGCCSPAKNSLPHRLRTVWRSASGPCNGNIDALGASSVPVVAESGHDGGVYILDSFSETPLFFNALELKATSAAKRKRSRKKPPPCGYPH